MLLPHGYEGQGAEHSSARMERYLQLCARDNMYIADVTTPAQIFHIFRRQLKANFRKPLIVFTPKSLLRHPKAVSTVDELASGSFQEVIDDASADVKKVKSLVFCTGKFYYDLLVEKEESKRDDVALVRLEQLFPLPNKKIDKILAKYKKADDLVWAQEEPRNMGAWSHILMHYKDANRFRVASRRIYAAPSAGSAVRSKLRHQQVIDYVFDKTKDNMTRPKSKPNK
jgi:2-oxoglutarate dehydrogenase E1 component